MKNYFNYIIFMLIGAIFIITFGFFCNDNDNTTPSSTTTSATITSISSSQNCIITELEPNNTCSTAQELLFVNNIASVTGIIKNINTTLHTDYYQITSASNRLDFNLTLNQPCGSCLNDTTVKTLLFTQASCSFMYYTTYNSLANMTANCSNPIASNVVIVNPGDTYILLVLSDTNNSYSDYTLTVIQKEYTSAQGEDCSNPIPITSTYSGIWNWIIYDFHPGSHCGGYKKKDVVFSFVCPSNWNGVTIDTLGSTLSSSSQLNDTTIGLFTSCTYSSEIVCNGDISSTNLLSSLSCGQLIPGATYYILIQNNFEQLGNLRVNINQYIYSPCTPPTSTYIEANEFQNYSYPNSEETGIVVNSSPQTIGGCFNVTYSSSGNLCPDFYSLTGPSTGWLNATMTSQNGLSSVFFEIFNTSNSFLAFSTTNVTMNKCCMFVGTNSLFYFANYLNDLAGATLPQPYQISFVEIPTPPIVSAVDSCSSSLNIVSTFPSKLTGTFLNYSSEQWWIINPDTTGEYYFNFKGYLSSSVHVYTEPVGFLYDSTCSGTNIATEQNGWITGSTLYTSSNWTGIAYLTIGNSYYLKSANAGGSGYFDVVVFK